jgi:hypothetical protein
LPYVGNLFESWLGSFGFKADTGYMTVSCRDTVAEGGNVYAVGIDNGVPFYTSKSTAEKSKRHFSFVPLFINMVAYRGCRGARIARREKRPIALALGLPSNEASRDASAIECHRIYE